MNARKILIILSAVCITVLAAAFVLVYYNTRYKDSARHENNKKERVVNNSVKSNKDENTVHEARTEKSELSDNETQEKTEVLPANQSTIDNLIAKLKSKDLKTRQDAQARLVLLKGQALPGLIQAYDSAAMPLKGKIVFTLGSIGDDDATSLLIQALNDENSYIRRNAAVALGKVRDKNALSALTASLRDVNSGVRERSAEALGMIDDAEAVDALIDRVLEDHEEHVKVAAVIALGEIKDRRAAQVLAEELMAKENISYKNDVAIALGNIGDTSALPNLYRHLEILEHYEPEEPMMKFVIDEAIRIAGEAIQKIELKNNV